MSGPEGLEILDDPRELDDVPDVDPEADDRGSRARIRSTISRRGTVISASKTRPGGGGVAQVARR